MTATLERTPRTTDARITGGRSEVVHTRVNASDDPIAHLTPEDIEEIGRELDAIRAEVARILASFGHGNGHVFNLGHGITPEVDPAHAGAFIESVHELSAQYHA